MTEKEIKEIKNFEQVLKNRGYQVKVDGVIAEGEISGYLHAITNGKLYEKDGKMIFEAGKDCVLTHPEHAAVQMPEGVYEIEIQAS